MGVQFPTERFGLFAHVLNFLEECLRMWLVLYFKIAHGVRWRGLRNIPREGGVVVAPNHTSFYDPALVGTPIRRRMRFMAYYKFFSIPGIGPLMKFAGAFPVDTSRPDRAAYEASLKVVGEDEDVVIIFPEGGRTRSGSISPIKPGAARVALTAGAWVVPVVALGPEVAWPYNRCVPRVGTPLNVKYYPAFRLEVPEGREAWNEAIAQINARIEMHWRRRIRAHARLQRQRGKAPTYAA